MPQTTTESENLSQRGNGSWKSVLRWSCIHLDRLQHPQTKGGTKLIVHWTWICSSGNQWVISWRSRASYPLNQKTIFETVWNLLQVTPQGFLVANYNIARSYIRLVIWHFQEVFLNLLKLITRDPQFGFKVYLSMKPVCALIYITIINWLIPERLPL
jgi:hypothetical protein